MVANITRRSALVGLGGACAASALGASGLGRRASALTPPAGLEPGAIQTSAGTLRTFDAMSRYGWITPDDGGKDILILGRQFEEISLRTANDGLRLLFDMRVRDTKGERRMVTKILAHDPQTLVARFDPVRVTFAPEEEMTCLQATVIWLNRRRRFGFLRRGDGAHIFLRGDVLSRSSVAYIRVGHQFDLAVGEGRSGLTVGAIAPFGTVLSS